jgi:hypothetical protein
MSFALVPDPFAMPPNDFRRMVLARPLAPATWAPLSAAEQARLHYDFMLNMAWDVWDHCPAWWWTADHRTLTELKLLCGRT